jgi:hypothetical protein
MSINNGPQNTKQKTKNWTKIITLKTGGELRCLRMVSNSCSTIGNCLNSHVIMMIEKRTIIDYESQNISVIWMINKQTYIWWPYFLFFFSETNNYFFNHHWPGSTSFIHWLSLGLKYFPVGHFVTSIVLFL